MEHSDINWWMAYVISVVIAYLVFAILEARRIRDWAELIICLLVFPVPLMALAWPLIIVGYISSIRSNRRAKQIDISANLTKPFIIVTPGPDDPTDIEPEMLARIEELSRTKPPVIKK